MQIRHFRRFLQNGPFLTWDINTVNPRELQIGIGIGKFPVIDSQEL